MEKVGFIGLGIMGKPMAINLIRADFPVVVLSQSKAAQAMVEAGAQTVSSRKDLASLCDILITMLPDSPEVEQVLSGPDGLLEGMREGTLFVDMSTVAPATARRVQALMQSKGGEALDAPVSGGQVGAEAASLSIMVGGSLTAFQRALPLFQAMGSNVVHIGETGTGQITKACNQMIVGITIQAVAEAFALASKAGVDLEKVRSVLLGGFAQSRILDLHGKRMIERDFKPGGKLKFHLKDMGIAVAVGEENSVSLPAAELVARQLQTAVDQGNGDLDHSALLLLLE